MIKDEGLTENAQKMGELTRSNLTAMKSPLVRTPPPAHTRLQGYLAHKKQPPPLGPP